MTARPPLGLRASWTGWQAVEEVTLSPPLHPAFERAACRDLSRTMAVLTRLKALAGSGGATNNRRGRGSASAEFPAARQGGAPLIGGARTPDARLHAETLGPSDSWDPMATSRRAGDSCSLVRAVPHRARGWLPSMVSARFEARRLLAPDPVGRGLAARAPRASDAEWLPPSSKCGEGFFPPFAPLPWRRGLSRPCRADNAQAAPGGARPGHATRAQAACEGGTLPQDANRPNIC